MVSQIFLFVKETKLFVILIFLLLSIPAFSQDVHLTQYYTSNLSLNPAWTGEFDGDIRVVANYRTQWRQVTASPFRTSMFSVEKKFTGFSLGGIFINDQISLYSLNTNKALLSGAYHRKFGENTFSLGLQAGAIFRNSDLTGQTFPGQWNYETGNFEESMSSQEAALTSSSAAPLVNAGIAWTRTFGDIKISAGYGLFNINRPNEGFLSDRKLPFRHAVNAAAVKPLPARFCAVPHLLYMRSASATDFILGVNLTRQLNDDFGFLVGPAYRGGTINSDAFIGIIGFSYKRFQFGFSTDLNISDLSKESRQKSAYEFSISYTTPSLFPSKFTIPCDRY